ncbi:MAG: ABC transporter permease [Proteobacteria bacterium]|nr:ABC transporter permease [Pseudomonadota bacterium]MBS0549808.1 ABC transporter permease [Pseudomonadota bacterium]
MSAPSLTTAPAGPFTVRLRLPWRRLRPVLLPLLFIAGCLAAWQVVANLNPQSRAVLSAPSDVIGVLNKNLPLLLPHLAATARETVAGFALAAIVGMVLGAALAQWRRVQQALLPHLVLFQIVPKIALAPLFIIWFGVGPESRLLFALFLAFFAIASATTAGLSATRPDALRLCASLTASPWQTFFAVRLPFAIPSIFAGLKMGMTMALIGDIVGEFVSGQEGLGYVVMFAAAGADAALTFAALTLLCALGLTVYGVVVLAEMAAERWYGAPFVSEGFHNRKDK